MLSPAVARGAYNETLHDSLREVFVPSNKLRRQIAWDAAQLIRAGQESDVGTARVRAARGASRGWIDDEDMPEEDEIRGILDSLASQPSDDRFDIYRRLVAALERVKLNAEIHPEGDALNHTLQVFDLARHERPFDEEFLLAALLHDVGKAIDRRDHIGAGLAALAGQITERTAWLIAHHTEANQLAEGKLGMRARRRLEADENFQELTLLSKCDRGGRMRNADVPDLDEVIGYLRELDRQCESGSVE
jgi:hypothetical protein